MTYAFRQGLDYGPRNGTHGLEFHMTEGNGGYGDVAYLMQHAGESRTQWIERIRGVSAHVVITSDGTVYQMVKFDHVSGNLNPADRAGEYGYYGHHHLVEVLGDPQWKDPNQWSLSAEIAGKRADGPTQAQVKAAIAWGLDMIGEFPTLRGAYGHHDQAPKGCPGTTGAMKAIFAGLGGHGLWSTTTAGGNQPAGGDMKIANANGYDTTSGLLLNVGKDALWTYLDGSAGGKIPADAALPTVAFGDGDPKNHLVVLPTGNPYADGNARPTLVVVRSSNTPYPAPAPATPAADCTDAVKLEHNRTKAAAVAAVEGIA